MLVQGTDPVNKQYALFVKYLFLSRKIFSCLMVPTNVICPQLTNTHAPGFRQVGSQSSDWGLSKQNGAEDKNQNKEFDQWRKLQ